MRFKELENFGRTQLSPNFFMREFLYSEISQMEGIPNLPDAPEIAITTGRRLCNDVLEPIQQSLGRISIRSGYRSPMINNIGASNRNQYNCASNKKNFGGHIWDYPDSEGMLGATACIVVCRYVQYFQQTDDWQSLANWLHHNIKHYSSICFFPNLCAFNISWREQPFKQIKSYINPKGIYRPTAGWRHGAPLPRL